ncbi:acetylcholine receptor subunit delta-like [Patella vulgata]|uniref:acetylcholine receptor subunit delta-like n=1 Tax=Patella vulgata TaxID=6465 RepID=UPI00217F4F15|nr:acetylcholine receptor subunit delta-like [Patella vulgata]
MLLIMLILGLIGMSACTDTVINSLYKKIFENYNPDVRPIINASAAQQRITLQITLSRYPLFYVLTIILPICLLVVLNPVVFLVPAESGEKISLPVSILLAYSVILSALSELLPEVSENISILGVYLT